MGTALSVSPMMRDEEDERKRKILVKPRLIVSAFGFKLDKQKSRKKVDPHLQQFQSNNVKEDLKESTQICPAQSGEIRTPSKKLKQTKQLMDVQKNQSSHQFFTSPVHFIIQTSTGELLLCLGRFLCRRCLKISDLTLNQVTGWVRNVDRTLLMQGWQEENFITSPILVFVYLLCRETVDEDLTSSDDLKGIFLTCLYLTYAYLGAEISYPLQPFITKANKDVFWQLALSVIDKLSSEMLRINMDPQFFTEVFQELKNEGKVTCRNDLDR